MILMKANKLSFFTLIVLLLMASLMVPQILPEHYLLDANALLTDQYNEKGLKGSFPFSFWFYDITGLNKIPQVLISIIQISIISFVLYLCGIPSKFQKLNPRNAIIFMGVMAFSIYLAIASKEFITFIYMGCLMILYRKPLPLIVKLIVTFLLILFFGWWYRQYFMLVPVIATTIYFISFILTKKKAIYNILISLIVACAISFTYGILSGQFMSESSREKLNEYREGMRNAETAITSPVETDSFLGEAVGIVYGYITVNVPVNGLKFIKKPQVLIFLVWQLILFMILYKYYTRILKTRKEYSHELWIFHMLFAYFVIQGIFEPDLGSAIKHKLGVFPLIWMAMYYDKQMIKRPEKINRIVFKKP